MSSVALHRLDVSVLLDLLEGAISETLCPKMSSSSGGFMLKPLKSGRRFLFLALFVVAASVAHAWWPWCLSLGMWCGHGGRGWEGRKGEHWTAYQASKKRYFR